MFGVELDQIFWLTVLVIFVVTIVGALAGQRRRDKCLRLFDDYHATYLGAGDEVLWGDLSILSQGLEVRFDAPFVNSRGLTKTASLVYADEVAKCRAICRTDFGLTDQERAARRKQIELTFNPNLWRKMSRSARNLINTLKDAIGHTLTLFVGRFSKAAPAGGAVSAQSKEIDQLGQELIGMVGNAYEPLLERYIGKPVILELGGGSGKAEFPGYLVDYTNAYLAVFNVEHDSIDGFELELGQEVMPEGVELASDGQEARIACAGPEALLLKRVQRDGEWSDLGVALMPGAALRIRCPVDGPFRLELERTRKLDLICPRAAARIRFGGSTGELRVNWHGVSPQEASGRTENQNTPSR